MTATLYTDRLVLRPVRLSDAAAIQRHFARWEIIQHLSDQIPWPYPDDGAETFLREVCLPGVEAGRLMAWAVTLRGEGDECIGLLEYRIGPEVDDHRGFWLAAPYQGRGLMTEAVIAFQDHVFFDLGVERIQVHSAVDNLASKRIKEKTGAVWLGVVELPHRNGEGRTDRWEVTRARWASIRGR